jgi:hypothetical protein
MGAWLRDLGLGQYEAGFCGNEIDESSKTTAERAAREPKKREAKARESYQGPGAARHLSAKRPALTYSGRRAHWTPAAWVDAGGVGRRRMTACWHIRHFRHWQPYLCKSVKCCILEMSL